MKKLIILFILLAITILAGISIATQEHETQDIEELEIMTQALLIQKQAELAEMVANKNKPYVCNE